MKAPFFKTPFNHDTNEESERTAFESDEPSMTQQHQKDDADINVIVKRFGVTGQLPTVQMPPSYENFGEIFDFQSAMETMKAATDSFMALPAATRSRFNNDPAVFVGYVDHCVEMGDLAPLREMNLALPEKLPPAAPPSQDPPTAVKGATPPPEPPKEPPGGSKS